MSKFCPFLKTDCMETKCQLWVPVNKKNSNCALAAIPGIIARDIHGITETLSLISRVTKI